MDLQAAHTSRMPGVCYARDVREGHGHVASLRSEFRGVSRNWHTCLGFGVPLPPRDEFSKLVGGESDPEAGQVVVHGGSAGQLATHKRSREEVGIELNNWLRLESIMQIKEKKAKRVTRAVKVHLIG